MKAARTLSAILLFTFTALLGSAHGESTKRVAVLPLTNGAGLIHGHVVLLTDAVRQQGITTLPRQFQMMTQANMMAFLPPGKTLADCIGQCAVETGKRLKAHYVVTGQVERLDDALRVVLSVHATKSGRFLETVELSGDSVLGLEREIRRRGGAVFAAISKDTKGSRFALGNMGGVIGDTLPPKKQEMHIPPRDQEFVRFESLPPGIQVTLDDKPLCRTPCQRVIDYGPHVIEFRSRCHRPERRRVRLSKMKETLKYDVRPTPVSKTTPLRVETSSGEKVLFSVFVNERLNAKAETPNKVELDLSTCVLDGKSAETSAADYEVKVVSPGYVPRSVRMAAGARAQTISLERMPTLNVECSDPGAPIFIDGKRRVSSPHRFSNLLPGKYVVACGRPDWPSAQRIVKLVADDTESIKLQVPNVAQVDLRCRGGLIENLKINDRVLKADRRQIRAARPKVKAKCVQSLKDEGLTGKKRASRRVYRARLADCLREGMSLFEKRARGVAKFSVERKSSVHLKMAVLPGEYTFSCTGAASSDAETHDIEPGGRYEIELEKPATPRHFGVNLVFEGGGGFFPAVPMSAFFNHDEGSHSVSMNETSVGVGTVEVLLGRHLFQFLSINLSFLAAMSGSDAVQYAPDGPGYDADYYYLGMGVVGEIYLMPHRSPGPLLSAGYFRGTYSLDLDRVQERNPGSDETDHTLIDSTTESGDLLRFKLGIQWKADNYPSVSPGVRLGVSLMTLTDWSGRQAGAFFGLDF